MLTIANDLCHVTPKNAEKNRRAAEKDKQLVTKKRKHILLKQKHQLSHSMNTSCEVCQHLFENEPHN